MNNIKNKFFEKNPNIYLSDILAILKINKKIKKNIKINNISDLINSSKNDVSFFNSLKYLDLLKKTNAKYVTTVEALVKKLSLYLSGSKYLIEENDQLYESGLLKLNCDKAINFLGWSPVLDFDETIEFIAEWYDNYYKKSVKTYDITINQILKYTDLAKNRGLEWFL